MNIRSAVLLFASMLPVALYFALFAALAAIAMVFPADLRVQAVPALLSAGLVLYWLPHWLLRALVLRPHGLTMQSRWRVFLICLAVFVAAVGAMVLMTAYGFTSFVEGLVLYYLIAFAGYLITAPRLWTDFGIGQGPEVF